MSTNHSNLTLEALAAKPVFMELVGLNGNAFSLLGAFQREARRQDWTEDEINLVRDEAMNGDYDHLLMTLTRYTTETPVPQNRNEFLQMLLDDGRELTREQQEELESGSYPDDEDEQ